MIGGILPRPSILKASHEIYSVQRCVTGFIYFRSYHVDDANLASAERVDRLESAENQWRKNCHTNVLFKKLFRFKSRFTVAPVGQEEYGRLREFAERKVGVLNFRVGLPSNL